MRRDRGRVILFTTGLLMAIHISDLKAEEGMWIPMLIERYQIDQMREAGLRLSAEEIYSINQDCLKDAIVIFGGGCTGEMISGDGLVLTNHHCGEGTVQSHSTVEHDYLTNGYWAMSREEELPNEGLSVKFLRSMREVTEEVMEGITPGMNPQVRERVMDENMGEIILSATSGTYYEGVVKPFYYGNAYYLFVYEKFLDVRLVGAPRVSIGNFGGDTDNWIWPRHTGDFMLFRVYANQKNQAAGYSPSNIPYKPRKHLEISAGGIKEGDFTMILGYPGSTTRYLYSEAVRAMVDESLPLKIGLRSSRLKIMERYMSQSDKVRIQYATKSRRVSNSWKKWQGIILGLNRMQAVEKKRAEEEAFLQWIKEDGERQLKYDAVIPRFQTLYEQIGQYAIAGDMMDEAIMAVELFKQAERLTAMMKQGATGEALEKEVAGFYKDYYMPIDREVFGTMMKAYYEQMPEEFLPEFFGRVKKKYKGDFQRFARDTYKKSMLWEKERVMKLLDTYAKNPDIALKKLSRDPVADYMNQFRELYRVRVNHEHYRLEEELEKNYKLYMSALMEIAGEKRLYPDANFTMRLTYGKVEGYQPRDGVLYACSSTLKGVMEKGWEKIADYAVPGKLVTLFETKDYDRYGVDGTMPVCFTASNHTSGGNSGSPVLNADGKLIGLNFDRNWEGTMSDVYYDPSLCRNISVDIRYVLFIVDKFAGAGYLLDEMDISW